jgi:hypothetical protein
MLFRTSGGNELKNKILIFAAQEQPPVWQLRGMKSAWPFWARESLPEPEKETGM